MDWVTHFLSVAELVKTRSKDKTTQIGAVIVGKNREILSIGYNSFPMGLNDDVPERQERPEKYFFFEHAERNSIYNAARIGVSTMDSEIYLTSGLPCCDCARAIINSGIKKVYCKRVCTTKNKDKWGEQQTKSFLMLKECGVSVLFYDDFLKK